MSRDAHEKRVFNRINFVAQANLLADGAWFFGLFFITAMLHWDSFRSPLAFKMIPNKKDPDYKPDYKKEPLLF